LASRPRVVRSLCDVPSCVVFSFKDRAPTGTYALSLHDALPISVGAQRFRSRKVGADCEAAADRAFALFQPNLRRVGVQRRFAAEDRKSTRLNSSHVKISYAVFCLKKKKQKSSKAE